MLPPVLLSPELFTVCPALIPYNIRVAYELENSTGENQCHPRVQLRYHVQRHRSHSRHPSTRRLRIYHQRQL